MAAANPIPNHTSVWYKHCGFFKTSADHYIGTDRTSPSHLICGKMHGSGKSHLTLHNDADPTSTILAHAESCNSLGTNSDLILSLPGQPEQKEKFTAHMRLTTERYDFVLQLPSGDVEKFEWRMSHSESVKALEGCKLGFKLVRVSADAQGSGGAESSDGHEILAVWADVSSKAELGRFELLGSAARGELGEAFKVAALITAVRIWQLRYIVATGHYP